MDKEELFKKEYLTIPETCFLLGGIPWQGVHKKIKNGNLEVVMKDEGMKGRSVQRIVTKSVIEYVLRRRASLLMELEKLKLPDELS